MQRLVLDAFNCLERLYEWHILQETLANSGSGYEIQGVYGKFYNSSYLDKANAFKRGPSLNTTCCHEKSPKHYHRPGSGVFIDKGHSL